MVVANIVRMKPGFCVSCFDLFKRRSVVLGRWTADEFLIVGLCEVGEWLVHIGHSGRNAIPSRSIRTPQRRLLSISAVRAKGPGLAMDSEPASSREAKAFPISGRRWCPHRRRPERPRPPQPAIRGNNSSTSMLRKKPCRPTNSAIPASHSGPCRWMPAVPHPSRTRPSV